MFSLIDTAILITMMSPVLILVAVIWAKIEVLMKETQSLMTKF